jgi:hypothetical protein
MGEREREIMEGEREREREREDRYERGGRGSATKGIYK